MNGGLILTFLFILILVIFFIFGLSFALEALDRYQKKQKLIHSTKPLNRKHIDYFTDSLDNSLRKSSILRPEESIMFERFTDAARKVFALANQEAQRLQHEYIGTEHILLGLFKEGNGVGAQVLRNADVNLEILRLEIDKLVKSVPVMVTMGKLPQSKRVKEVIDFAIEEARSMNHNYVGTEHILLGLLRVNEGIAFQVLMNLRLKLEDIRKEVLNLISPAAQDNMYMSRTEVQKQKGVDFQCTALAGQFLVAGKLFKCQLQVSITVGNAKGIHIFAYNPDINRTFNIRVITVQRTHSFQLSKDSVHPEHIYAFVLLHCRYEEDEYFIVPGKTILENPYDFYSSYYVCSSTKIPEIDYDSLVRYKDNWKVFEA